MGGLHDFVVAGRADRTCRPRGSIFVESRARFDEGLQMRLSQCTQRLVILPTPPHEQSGYTVLCGDYNGRSIAFNLQFPQKQPHHVVWFDPLSRLAPGPHASLQLSDQAGLRQRHC